MKRYELFEDIWGVIQKNQMLREKISHNLELDFERIKLLHEIFLELNNMQTDEIRSMVYKYGSLVKEPNLLARQLFLCLLAIVESKDEFIEEVNN